MDNPTLFQALHWKFINDGLLVGGKNLNNKFIFYKIIDFVLVLYIKFDNNCGAFIDKLKNEILMKGAQSTSWVVKSPFTNSIVVNPDGNVQRKKIRVLRIECSTSRDFYNVKYFLENYNSSSSFQLFNNKIKPIVQFFAEQPGFQPCGWFILEASSKKMKQIVRNAIIVGVNSKTRASSFLKPCPEIKIQVPLSVCSYSLKTQGTNKPIYQIGMIWNTLFQNEKQKQQKQQRQILLTQSPCLPITDSQVQHCGTEKEMLIHFIRYLKLFPTDFLIGFNIYNFNNSFIRARCMYHKIDNYFLQLHRDSFTHSMNDFFLEKISGKGENYNTILDFQIFGTICIDLKFISIKEDKNILRTFSLNAVSEKYLGGDKNVLDYKEVDKLFKHGNGESFQKLGIDSLQECQVSLELLEKLNVLLYQINYSNLTFFPLNMIFSYGEQAKIYSIVYNEGGRMGFIFKPVVNLNRGGFCGGMVINPIPGCYKLVMVFDFKSLYPSVIIANNLCPSTFINNMDRSILDKAIEKNNVDTFKGVDGNFVYVANGLGGVIPEIEKKLLRVRLELKEEMKKNSKGSFLYQSLDSKQLAMKVSANSLYGVFGAEFGELQCVPFARTTAAIGRDMIQDAVKYLNTNKKNLKVIYGDSVPKWSIISLIRENNPKPQPITCESLWAFIQQKRQEFLLDAFSPQSVLNKKYLNVQPMVDDQEKEVFYCSDLNLFTWSDTGKTQIHSIIRHKPRVQKMYRIVTRGGIIEVTPDHSVLKREINGSVTVTKPCFLKIGDKLASKKFDY